MSPVIMPLELCVRASNIPAGQIAPFIRQQSDSAAVQKQASLWMWKHEYHSDSFYSLHRLLACLPFISFIIHYTII